jgi:hypothetical protein
MNELVCISKHMTTAEAHVAKLALKEAEIPCFLADSNCAGLFSNALGGVKLMVPADDVERANEILNDSAADGEDLIGDAWHQTTPGESENVAFESDIIVRLNEREESADRAFRASLVGLLFLPLQLYVLYLLIFKVLGSDQPLNPRSRRSAWIALSVCIPSLLLLYTLMRV